jgi:hypothetical protein
MAAIERERGERERREREERKTDRERDKRKIQSLERGVSLTCGQEADALFFQFSVEVVGAELEDILGLGRNHFLIEVVQDLCIGLRKRPMDGRLGCSRRGKHESFF